MPDPQMSPQQAVEQFFGVPQTQDAATAHGGAPAQAPQPHDPLSQIGQTVGDLGRGLAQEGLAGLLDPVGMMDRMQAQRDLSDRFQVVPDDFVGPRNHNQVSQAEYERIAATYSDIRLGRGDLTINTSEMTDAGQIQRYRAGAMSSIADMMMTTAGRDQIFNMSNNVAHDDAGNARLDASGNPIHHHTTIRALYNDTNNDDNLTNDGHTEADYYNGNAFADAAGAHGENGAIDTSGRGRWSRDVATGARGQGTDSTIWWNPTASVDDCHRADVVLDHEMQHAMHETQGTMARGQYGGTGPDRNINNFERQAVGLDHHGDSQVAPWSGPFGIQIPSHWFDDAGSPENVYRQQRNELGLGDNFLQRPNYSGRMPGQAPP